MLKYIKYMPYRSMTSASRNKRELSAAVEAGFDVKVFCDDKTDKVAGMSEDIPVIFDDVIPIDYSIPKLKRWWLIIKNDLTVMNRTKKLDCDVLSCHDLSSLRTAYLAFLFKRKKPKLIYDSHEFELGRNTSRGKLGTAMIKFWEGKLIKKSVFTIVVSDGIADELQKIYKMDNRPVVIRSIPNKWSIDRSVCDSIRKEIMSKFSSDVDTLIMFHGNLGNGNGIEDVIPALADLPGVGMALLGRKIDDRLFDSFFDIAKKNGVEDRVIYLPAVDINELWKYVGAADVEMMMIVPIVRSHYLCLPNKMFESIQSEVPVIASDLPEMVRVVNEYNIGLTCPPGDTAGIAACIRKMIEDRQMYEGFKTNLAKAKDELCWECEKLKLMEAFRLLE